MERTPLVSVVIPVGAYHREIAERAIQSALDQTIACNVVAVYDHEGRGAGWARNQGLGQVDTPFVVFLDSDDLIAPYFIEKTLRAYDGKHYVYTNWLEAEEKGAPPCPWVQGYWHVVTTLLPTSFVRYIGGFDEQMPAGEDSDFYTKLTRAGLCGKHLQEPLFRYCKGGQRTSALFEGGVQTDPPVFSATYREIRRLLNERYGGMFMPCCGDIPNLDEQPAGSPNAGDVLATSLWKGNRQERGRQTGRLYPRTGNGKRLWMDGKDIDAAPHLFARVVELPPPVTEDDLQAWRQFSAEMHDALGSKPPVVQSPVPAGVARGEVAPNVGQVLRLYQQHT